MPQGMSRDQWFWYNLMSQMSGQPIPDVEPSRSIQDPTYDPNFEPPLINQTFYRPTEQPPGVTTFPASGRGPSPPVYSPPYMGVNLPQLNVDPNLWVTGPVAQSGPPASNVPGPGGIPTSTLDPTTFGTPVPSGITDVPSPPDVTVPPSETPNYMYTFDPNAAPQGNIPAPSGITDIPTPPDVTVPTDTTAPPADTVAVNPTMFTPYGDPSGSGPPDTIPAPPGVTPDALPATPATPDEIANQMPLSNVPITYGPDTGPLYGPGGPDLNVPFGSAGPPGGGPNLTPSPGAVATATYLPNTFVSNFPSQLGGVMQNALFHGIWGGRQPMDYATWNSGAGTDQSWASRPGGTYQNYLAIWRGLRSQPPGTVARGGPGIGSGQTPGGAGRPVTSAT